jgi:hypothetical protein
VKRRGEKGPYHNPFFLEEKGGDIYIYYIYIERERRERGERDRER